MKRGPLSPAERQHRRDRRAWLKAVRARRALARALIHSGYRPQARALHPDVGGSPEAMHQLTTIRDALLLAVDDTARFARVGYHLHHVHIADAVLMGSDFRPV